MYFNNRILFFLKLIWRLKNSKDYISNLYSINSFNAVLHGLRFFREKAEFRNSILWSILVSQVEVTTLKSLYLVQ